MVYTATDLNRLINAEGGAKKEAKHNELDSLVIKPLMLFVRHHEIKHYNISLYSKNNATSRKYACKMHEI